MSVRALLALLLGLSVLATTDSIAAAPPDRRLAGMMPFATGAAGPVRVADGISEAQAVRAALGCVSGGEPLKVNRQGDGFSITVLKGSQVRVVRVDSGGRCR